MAYPSAPSGDRTSSFWTGSNTNHRQPNFGNNAGQYPSSSFLELSSPTASDHSSVNSAVSHQGASSSPITTATVFSPIHPNRGPGYPEFRPRYPHRHPSPNQLNSVFHLGDPFTTDSSPDGDGYVSRYVKVGMPTNLTTEDQEKALAYLKTYGPFNNTIYAAVTDESFLLFMFDDLESAIAARNLLLGGVAGGPGWHCEYSSFFEWKEVKQNHYYDSTNFEGQVMLRATISQEDSKIETVGDINWIAERAFAYANSWGNVRAFDYLSHDGNACICFRVEFQKLSDAWRFVKASMSLTKLEPFEECSFQVTEYIPVDQRVPVMTLMHNTYPRNEYNNRYASRARGTIRMPENSVNIDRILKQEDFRTTVMLRNIPNKVTHHELKEVIDMSSFGLYDLVYLRVDFANGCNVGYAFINFISPMAMIPFVRHMNGYRWDYFRCNKVAVVSYATVQGLDALTNNYRNSQVTREWPWARPKLYHTFEDGLLLVGKQRPLPPPNNLMKLRRSQENARNVGLYAPRDASAHDPRRRHSMFDRGTPRDAQYGSGSYRTNVYHPHNDTNRPIGYGSRGYRGQSYPRI